VTSAGRVQARTPRPRTSAAPSAARELEIDTVRLLDEPDGDLAGIEQDLLVAEVAAAVRAHAADGLVVFDLGGVTGHPDHNAATRAAVAAADVLGLGVLAWTLPADVTAVLNGEFGAGFVGREPEAIDLVLPVDRTRQRGAVAAHPSQAVPGSVLWRRLDLLGNHEHLRWLRHGPRLR
jgi:LmbE family N-acetylglucosaminyl deacetylase